MAHLWGFGARQVLCSEYFARASDPNRRGIALQLLRIEKACLVCSLGLGR